MKTTVYLRVAHGARGPRVQASAKPSAASILDSYGDPIPTVRFAVRLDIPEEAFREAERVIAELVVPETAVEVAAEVGS